MNFTPFGFFTFDKGVNGMYLKLPDFTHVELAVYSYILSNVQNQDNGNGKKGYCYKTKVRISNELKISRNRLNKAIDILTRYKLIECREVPNWKGGHNLTEYKPLQLLGIASFIGEFGHLLSEWDYDYLFEKLHK